MNPLQPLFDEIAKPMKKKYLVTFTHVQYSRAEKIIEADSQEQAEAIAEDIYTDEIEEMNPIDGDLIVESVDPLKRRV